MIVRGGGPRDCSRVVGTPLNPNVVFRGAARGRTLLGRGVAAATPRVASARGCAQFIHDLAARLLACRSLDRPVCMATLPLMVTGPVPAGLLRHRRAPAPLCFPTEAVVPETKEHFELRTLLYDVLMLAFAAHASIGSDQFVYWNGRDPKRCVAPDAFVCWGTPDEPFPAWKTWERATPQLAVEISSTSDRSPSAWEAKLELYQELGVRELVRLDTEAPAGARLRVWDRAEDDLVEREVTGDTTPCVTLSGRRAPDHVLFWVLVPSARHPTTLRLCEDAEGRSRLPTASERATHDAAHRIAALEAELASRGARRGG